MTYEETMDRCSIIRDTLIAGHSTTIESTCKNIEWMTMCADAAEKLIPNKPYPTKDVGADEPLWGEGYCPACGHYIRKHDQYCYKCGQAIDWSEEE